MNYLKSFIGILLGFLSFIIVVGLVTGGTGAFCCATHPWNWESAIRGLVNWGTCT